MENLGLRRSAGEMDWSGSIQDELRRHAAAMAARGELDHSAMDERVGGLPDGWSGYGETTYTGNLDQADAGEVEAWCRGALDAFWGSDPHRRVLEEPAHEFVSVGTHWDGLRLWVAVGVFTHQSYTPPTVPWPRSYAERLVGGWDGHFFDDDGSAFEADIDRVAGSGLARGCNPPMNTRFCPGDPVTRAEMAAFLIRAFGWSASEGDRFVDDDGSVFEHDIEVLSHRGVTEGCNPPHNDRFCPERPVTRGEMATFLGRALGLEPRTGHRFSDTSGSVHAAYIEALAEEGITSGCDDTRYCPHDPLTRAQMAAFLVRAGLSG